MQLIEGRLESRNIDNAGNRIDYCLQITHSPADRNDIVETGTGGNLVGSAGVQGKVGELTKLDGVCVNHHCLGNRTHAANILGISIRTMRNKLKQYSDEGIDVPTPREMRAAY